MRAGRAAVHGVVVAQGARGRAASERRPAARLPGRCRRRRAARHRLRRAERARRHQGAVRAASAPSCRRRRRARASRSAIELGKLRGVESRGMLCSARELKLSDDHGGLLILDDDAVGRRRPARSSCSLDDTLFTLKLTPNLGHCLSVFGIAREVAALTGAPLQAPAFPPVARAQRRARCRCASRRPTCAGAFRAASSAASTPTAPTPRVDGRSPGALRPALGLAAGRHLELRDVRVRPAVAHLRPRQDPRRPDRALGPRRASRSSC